MRIPFFDYLTPRIFPKLRRVHRLKASGTIIVGLVNVSFMPTCVT